MTIKSAIAALTFAAGLIAAPAFAQDAMATNSMEAMPTMIGTQAVSEADAPLVAKTCTQLNLSTNTSLNDSTQDGAAGQNTTSEDTSRTTDNPPAEGLAPAVAKVDLNAITLEECQSGGWIK